MSNMSISPGNFDPHNMPNENATPHSRKIFDATKILTSNLAAQVRQKPQIGPIKQCLKEQAIKNCDISQNAVNSIERALSRENIDPSTSLFFLLQNPASYWLPDMAQELTDSRFTKLSQESKDRVWSFLAYCGIQSGKIVNTTAIQAVDRMKSLAKESKYTELESLLPSSDEMVDIFISSTSPKSKDESVEP